MAEIYKVIEPKVGDIYSCITTDIALKNMKDLHEQGIETKLYSDFDGKILRSYEIIYVPERKNEWNKNK